ncbi:free fatty acid receptor 3-like isoform X2 [Takifugu rubripes]|uniref:free fatty acid receptor 3-like isoform X2 n=1 Tax=Takifugu rubripes TaxID=31033 RepID=UPI0011451DE8|nr:free fatty acid receptor 3-like isoform X2 [Takifugu rubripes]XP_056876501.1 free fatty acid receptor 3-like isoform X2 [Takifugu flavidus]
MLYSRLLLAVYILTFLMGVPANVLAFCAFCRKVRRKATPIDVLLLNLTISDLIFLAFLPFKMKEALDDMAWLLPYALCPFTGFLFYVTIYNSTLFLTAVSVERYLGVAFPLRYSLCRRPRYAVLASVMFWVVSCLNLSIVYIMPYAQWTNSSATPPSTCYLEFSENELSILVRQAAAATRHRPGARNPGGVHRLLRTLQRIPRGWVRPAGERGMEERGADVEHLQRLPGSAHFLLHVSSCQKHVEPLFQEHHGQAAHPEVWRRSSLSS